MSYQVTALGAGSNIIHLPTEELMAIWNGAFGPEFRLTERLWMQNTVDDPSFEPSDLLLGQDAAGGLAGFLLTKRFRDTKEYQGADREKYNELGYIAALAVKPECQRQGLGRQLLTAAEAKFRAEGVKRVQVGGNFRHFFPGLPAGYEPARHLFEGAGYTFNLERPEYDLDGPLTPEVFEPALAQVREVTYRQGHPDDWKKLLTFLAQTFPGRWLYEVGLYMEQGGFLEDITLLLDQEQTVKGFLMNYWARGQVIGPSLYWLTGQPEWGGIGPLGISRDVRGKGAGLGLVASGMQYLYGKGARQARIDWTTLADFYGRLGFKPSITYWQGLKEL